VPVLKNLKHERFAQEIVKGASAREAYASAGYGTKTNATTDAASSRLLSDVKVKARVEELQERAAGKAAITLEGHLSDLKDLRDAAKGAKQFAAAISAEIARGKASGVHVEKVEMDHAGRINITISTDDAAL